MYTYNAKIINVVDGDTFDVDIDLGFNLRLRERIRLLEIDTPESKTKDPAEKELGLACKEFAKRKFLNLDVVIQTVKTDSFGRWLAYVSIGELNLVDYYNRLGINKKNDTYETKSLVSRLSQE